MQDFHSLDVWEKAHALTLSVYQATQAMPREEVFGITMQLRRGATVIATRIAEGCGRESNVEFAVDLRKAVAGCNEVEYLILLAKDLEHLKPEKTTHLTEDTVQVRKMLFGLLRKL
jgi:four helix bundle protein